MLEHPPHHFLIDLVICIYALERGEKRREEERREEGERGERGETVTFYN